MTRSLLALEIRPIQSVEERKEVIEAGKNNGGRCPIFPTHVVLKEGEIVGAFCTWSPTVYWWMHSEKIRGRESLSIFQSLDTLMTEKGLGTYILPCEFESPYFKLLSNKLEYLSPTSGDDWRLFLNKTN